MREDLVCENEDRGACMRDVDIVVYARCGDRGVRRSSVLDRSSCGRIHLLLSPLCAAAAASPCAATAAFAVCCHCSLFRASVHLD